MYVIKYKANKGIFLVSPRNAIWGTREQNSIAMTRHHPDLGSASYRFNEKRCPDVGSDVSSVWNFCSCSSDVILRGNKTKKWRHYEIYLLQRLFHGLVGSRELILSPLSLIINFHIPQKLLRATGDEVVTNLVPRVLSYPSLRSKKVGERTRERGWIVTKCRLFH